MDVQFYELRGYMAARGPRFDQDAPSPRYKLCVVATDLDYLIAFLKQSMSRPDGYYAKYAAQPKDGMYLGRIFLEGDESLGKLWAEIKNDPKLIASVQDDHFIEAFRCEESVENAQRVGE